MYLSDNTQLKECLITFSLRVSSSPLSHTSVFAAKRCLSLCWIRVMAPGQRSFFIFRLFHLPFISLVILPPSQTLKRMYLVPNRRTEGKKDKIIKEPLLATWARQEWIQSADRSPQSISGASVQLQTEIHWFWPWLMKELDWVKGRKNFLDHWSNSETWSAAVVLCFMWCDAKAFCH